MDPLTMALIGYAVPKLLDVGIPAWFAGRKGDVEKGMQSRMEGIHKATAGGRDAESATAQNQRNIQMQSQLQQAMNNLTQGVARGSASSPGAQSGSQLLASMAGNKAAQQALNMNQSQARQASLQKSALMRQEAANLENQLLGSERERLTAQAEVVNQGFQGAQGGTEAGAQARNQQAADLTKAIIQSAGGAG